MIKNLHIQNYRSIRDMSLELEQLNIVFGPNGTGKSNIYKAIYLMHSAAQGQFSRGAGKRGGHFESVLGGQNPQRPAAAHEPRRWKRKPMNMSFRSGLWKSCPTPHSFSSIR